jgi:hypothetical protein
MWRLYDEARLFALQCIAAAVPVVLPFQWLGVPAREGGLAVGATIGLGNALRWTRGHAQSVGPAGSGAPQEQER